MVILACPDTLANMSVNATSVYVSDIMRHLITDPRYKRGPDGKYHHYQEPCSRLHEYIICYVPPVVAREVTVILMNNVSVCYLKIMVDRNFRNICKEIAPHVLKAVIHPLVKCLDFKRNEDHPTLLDFYKDVNGDLVYMTLPLLHGLKKLRIGLTTSLTNVSLDVERFKDTLEEFSTHNFMQTHMLTLANTCKKIRCLDLAGRMNTYTNILNLISRFECVEELNLSLLGGLSSDDLLLILYWLVGIIPFYELSWDCSADINTFTEDTSGISAEALVEQFVESNPGRHSGQLKSFGCANVSDEHIKLIAMFCNLTSLVLCDVTPSCSLAPLRNLNVLKTFTLMRSHFSDVEELLKAIGNQLVCLNIINVIGTNFTFISENCRSLECLHLLFRRSKNLLLPAKYRHIYSHVRSLPDFPLVATLQLYVTERLARRYILSRFPNLRKLTVQFPGDDSILFNSIMHRTRLRLLEELHWGRDTVILFSARRAIVYRFGRFSDVIVQHILT